MMVNVKDFELSVVNILRNFLTSTGMSVGVHDNHEIGEESAVLLRKFLKAYDTVFVIKVLIPLKEGLFVHAPGFFSQSTESKAE
jgi:hypothetical protein